MDKTDSTVINLWNRIKVYCLNHDEPEEMSIIQNLEKIKTPFYACSHYLDDPKAGNPCKNRLNLDDYQGLVMEFIGIVAEGGPIADYTNYRFEYKGTRQKISVKVLLYTDKEIRLGILNKTVFGVK